MDEDVDMDVKKDVDEDVEADVDDDEDKDVDEHVDEDVDEDKDKDVDDNEDMDEDMDEDVDEDVRVCSPTCACARQCTSTSRNWPAVSSRSARMYSRRLCASRWNELRNAFLVSAAFAGTVSASSSVSGRWAQRDTSRSTTKQPNL